MTQSPIAGNSSQTHPPGKRTIQCAYEAWPCDRCRAFFTPEESAPIPPDWSRGTEGITYNDRKYYCNIHKEVTDHE